MSKSLAKPPASAKASARLSRHEKHHVRIEDMAVGRTNLFTLKSWRDAEPALELIEGKKQRFNTREDFADIFQFAESLADGIREPLRGYMGTNGKFQIVDGERRWRGAKILAQRNLTIPIPVIREPQHYTPSDRALDLLRMNNGKPLGILEQAHAMQRAITVHGHSPKDLHIKAGCSPTHVTNCLTLLQTAPDVQEAVAKGEMAASLAIELHRVTQDKQRQSEIVQQGRAKAEEKAKAKPSRNGKTAAKQPKITSKLLSVPTGKKAQAEKKGKKAAANPELPLPEVGTQKSGGSITSTSTITRSNPQSEIRNPKLLQDLVDAVGDRSMCKEPIRYEVLEYLLEYLGGRETLTNTVKFILGII